MVANVRQQYTNTLVDLQNLPRAQEVAAECESNLKQWCSENDITWIYNIPTWINLQEIKLSLISDPVQKLERVEELLPYAERSSRRMVINLLNSGAEAILQTALITGSQDISKYYSFRKRAEYEDEYVQEDLCSLVGHRYDMHTVSQRTLVDQQKELEWIDGFFAKYPNF